MLNEVQLQGRLAADPEMRRTAEGIVVVTFRLAVQHGDHGCSFFPVTAWRKNGEFVNRYFRKGQMMVLRGHLQQRRWVDADGNNKSAVSVTADEVWFSGNRREDTAEVAAVSREEENDAEYGDANLPGI